MTIDPQFQRRLLAASGFAELSLFQEAVEELEELPESSKELADRAGGLVGSLSALAEMVRSRIRRHPAFGNGTRRAELADRSCLCDPAKPWLGFRPRNSAAEPARNFRTAGPFSSILPATPRNSANWTKRANVFPGQFSSTKHLRRWRRPIQISSRYATRLIEDRHGKGVTTDFTDFTDECWEGLAVNP